MEEQKNNGKEVKMQPVIGSNQEGGPQHEFTKEQLKEMVDKLFNENRWLRQQNQQMNQALMGFERLDYLLRVINAVNGCRDYSFDADFVQRCINEIQKAMTPPEDNQTTEENKGN